MVAFSSDEQEPETMLRSATEKHKTNQILDLTSLTVEEFEELLGPFDQAFVQHVHEWTMEGKPRTARAATPSANLPLPSAEDRLLFVRCSLKIAVLHVAHGAVFGIAQPNANKWIQILLRVLDQTLVASGATPARHLVALTERLALLQATEQRIPTLFSRWYGTTNHSSPGLR